MKPTLALRIAAVIMFLHAAGHTVGISTWKDTSDGKPADVIQGMLEKTFMFMGTQATFGKFYEGFGQMATITLLLAVVLLWLLSGADHVQTKLARHLATTLAIFLAILGALELVYFFPFAAAFSLVSAVLVAYARWRMQPV